MVKTRRKEVRINPSLLLVKNSTEATQVKCQALTKGTAKVKEMRKRREAIEMITSLLSLKHLSLLENSLLPQHLQLLLILETAAASMVIRATHRIHLL